MSRRPCYHPHDAGEEAEASLPEVTELVTKIRVSLEPSDPRTLIFNNRHHSVFIPVGPEASWSTIFITKKVQRRHSAW